MGLKILKYLLFLLISIIPAFTAKADYNFREDKNRQILIYKLEIEKLESSVFKNNFLLGKYYDEMKVYDDSISMISKFLKEVDVKKLNPMEKELLDEAYLSENTVKIEKLKAGFKQRVIWLYKYGIDYDEQVLFASGSMNEFYVRLLYLNKLSQIRKSDLLKIKNNQYTIEEKRKMYNLSRLQKFGYIRDKKENQRTLLEKKTLVENIIKSLKSENENFTRQSEAKKRKTEEAEKQIQSYRDNFSYPINQKIDYAGSDFPALKGKLIIPVQSVNIINDFGANVNPETKTITFNNGVDVSIAKGSEVKCVADGYIESIQFIPMYGNVIVINHSNGYRSLYAIIEDISVEPGQTVTAGTPIARTYENLNGQSFHFEIWKDAAPLNPKYWLRHK